MKDIPYSELKRDKRAYEIMLHRDQCGDTFAEIAKSHGMSVTRVIQVYNKIKLKQINLYIRHIAVVLGHETDEQIRNVYRTADECYQDRQYICAFFESEYKGLLAKYRDGEPGLPEKFIKSIPPLKSGLDDKSINRIIEMRNIEKASFSMIAATLNITQAKARHAYNHFYHEHTIKIVKDMQEQAKSNEEKSAIWDYYFRGFTTSKKRYDALTRKKRTESLPDFENT